jgi:hypothetical protein
MADSMVKGVNGISFLWGITANFSALISISKKANSELTLARFYH